MSIVDLKSDLSKFRRVVPVQQSAESRNVHSQGSGTPFGQYTPITNKIQEISKTPDKAWGDATVIDTLPIPEVRRGLSSLSPISMAEQSPSISVVRNMVSVSDLVSKYNQLRETQQIKGRHTKSDIAVSYDTRKIDWALQSKSVTKVDNTPMKVVSSVDVVPVKPMQHTSTVDIVNTSTASGHHTSSDTQIRRIQYTDAPKVKDIRISQTTPTGRHTDSEVVPQLVPTIEHVSNVVINTTSPSGRNENSRVQILAGALTIDRKDQSPEVTNLVKISGRFETSDLDVLMSDLTSKHEDGDTQSKFNLDGKPRTTRIAGRHDDGNKASSFNPDGKPTSISTVSGRYEAPVNSLYNFGNKIPEVDFFKNINADGFTLKQNALETLYKGLSQYGFKSPSGVNFFKDDNANGFVINTKPLDTEFVGASKYSWKGSSKSGPTVNAFKNVNATGFTKFAKMNRSEYAMNSSAYNFDQSSKAAPTVNYFQNIHTKSGFDRFMKQYDSKFIGDSSQYTWKSSAPETDFFANTNASGFKKFAKTLDTRYVHGSSKYDWDGTVAPEVNYFQNINASGFNRLAKMLETKYIHGSSKYDWDGPAKSAPASNAFTNQHVTTGFHTFAKMFDTKYIKDASRYDFDGDSKSAPETDYFSNVNASGFVKFVKMLDTKYVPDSSKYDFDGSTAPVVNFFTDTNSSGFHSFAQMLDSKFVHGSSKYDFDGAPPTTDFFANTNASGFHSFATTLEATKYINNTSRYGFATPSAVDFFANSNAGGFGLFAQSLVTNYIPNSSKYGWSGGSKSSPSTDYFTNMNADGFTTFTEMLETKYKVETTRLSWNGGSRSGPSVNFFTDANAKGFVPFKEALQSDYNTASTRYSWNGGRKQAPATNFFSNDHVVSGFTTFAQVGNTLYKSAQSKGIIKPTVKGKVSIQSNDGGSLVSPSVEDQLRFLTSKRGWSGTRSQAPETNMFDDMSGHSGFKKFSSNQRESRYRGVDVNSMTFEYPDLPGFGKRLVPRMPSIYNPNLLNLVDLTNTFIPNLNDVIGDITNLNVGGITNQTISGVIANNSPALLGNTTGYVVKKALGVVSKAVPSVGTVLDASVNKLLQKTISNPTLKAIVNSLVGRRAVSSIPFNSSQYMVFSPRTQYASTYGNYTQDAGISSIPLDGANVGAELSRIGVNIQIPGTGSQKGARVNRLEQRYNIFLPNVGSPNILVPGLDAVVSRLRTTSKIKAIHTVFNPFPESQNIDSDDPSRQRSKQNIYLDKLRKQGLMRYGFIDKKAYATWLNETYTTPITDSDDPLNNAALSKHFDNSLQRPQFESQHKKLHDEFNSISGEFNAISTPNAKQNSPINVGIYDKLNRNPFNKRHDDKRTIGLHQGPALNDANPIRNYRTVAYKKLKKEGSSAYNDFRQSLEEAVGTDKVLFSTDPKAVSYAKNNLETKYGLGGAGKAGADRTNPFTNTVKYLADSNGGNQKNRRYGVPTLVNKDIPFRGDRINLIDYKRTQGRVTDNRVIYERDALGNVNDLVEFYFTGAALEGSKMSPAEAIVFRATFGNIQVSYSPEWQAQKMLGRGDPVYVYQGMESSLSFDFMVAAQSRDEMKAIWRKLNALAAFTAPEYTTRGLMRGPIMRLNLGHMYRKTPGFLSSLNYSIDNAGTTWETAGNPRDKVLDESNPIGALQLPKIVTVSVSYTLIHNYRPQRNGVFFNMYDDTSSPGLIPKNKSAVNYFRTVDDDGESVGLAGGIQNEADSPKFHPKGSVKEPEQVN